MPWIKLDDSFPYDGKIMEAGPFPRLLYIYCLCYCGKELTDGFVPRKTAALMATLADVEDWESAAKRLVTLGLWTRAEDGTGFFVVNYLKYNPSRDEHNRYVEQRREAGRLGGRPRKTAPTPPNNRDANHLGYHNGTEMPSEGKPASKAVPVPVPVPVSGPVPVPHDQGADAPAPAARQQVALVSPLDGDRPAVMVAAPTKPARETCLSAAQLADFDRWWFGPWPKERRVKRKQAEEAWKRVNPTGALTDTIIAGTERQHQGRRWRQGYIADPPGWLRDRRWNDEIEEVHDDPGRTATPGERGGYAASGLGRGGAPARGGHRTYSDGDYWPERQRQ